MATQAQVTDIASWETNYANTEKSLKALVRTLALAASSRPELEQQLKNETEQRAMWQDLFVDARTEINKLKVEHSVVLEQNITLAHDKGQIDTDRATLGAELTKLKKEHAQLIALQSSSHSSDSTFSVVLIDGDGLIFDIAYLRKGSEGGKEAALALRNGLTKHFPLITPNVRICVYLNKLGLSRALMEDSIVNPNDFDAFVKGFQAAHTSTAVIDVGYGKEAADAKIRDAVNFYLGLSECKLAILGASHDNGYSTLLRSLRTDGKMGRVRLLKGYECVAQELKEFDEWMEDIPGLFLAQKLGNGKHSPRSHSPVTPSKSVSAAVSFSAAAQTSSNASNGTPAGWQVVAFKSSKKPLVTTIEGMKPRPCHAEYLRGGCTNSLCEFGHDYELSKNAMNELVRFAKRMACGLWLIDLCPYEAETCINGHLCPRGQQCPYRGISCYFQKWHDENPGPRLK